jgi:hypothetical protein
VSRPRSAIPIESSHFLSPCDRLLWLERKRSTQPAAAPAATRAAPRHDARRAAQSRAGRRAVADGHRRRRDPDRLHRAVPPGSSRVKRSDAVVQPPAYTAPALSIARGLLFLGGERAVAMRARHQLEMLRVDRAAQRRSRACTRSVRVALELFVGAKEAFVEVDARAKPNALSRSSSRARVVPPACAGGGRVRRRSSRSPPARA